MAPSPREEPTLSPPVPPESDDACVLWHRRNLRLTDDRAVEYATANYDTVCPLFIFDPRFYGADGLACDARLRFLHECLADLEDQYTKEGTTLVYAHGSPVDVLDSFLDAGWDAVVNREATGRYGKERDDALAARDGVRFVADDGIRYGQSDREGWAEHAESYFESDPNRPHESGFGRHDLPSTVDIDAIEGEYDVSPSKTDVPTGGRTAALARLDRFLDVVHEYQANVSSPLGAATRASRLSAHLRFGALSVREVYQALDDAIDSNGKEAFVSRLFWNRHYTQKLADWSGWMDTAVNPVLEGIYADNGDEELIRAWKRGRTGFPMVDASMRCLRETGWLNFRMRAMCASVFSFVLKQPWQVGADYMYYHLIDADPAINYTQWQSQSGLKGIGAIRVYNPRKQVRDNDPEGDFVKRWVPELDPVPAKYLDRPERMPLSLQDELGVDVGEDYPYPVVDYDRERRAALDTFAGLRAESEAAMREPDVFRRASLSPKSRNIVEQATTRSDGAGTQSAESAGSDSESANEQAGLDQF
ncbi:deoxyribodipyrimidine photo-lyase [Halogeometricum luteum]|uniref:DNA photolyase family protein n=1 Tax=Halogeometricum luteum TaxID=2950537 RepID=A0ABU2G0J5_9EURY|nr:deoxyribodipyrimidine photo-lyase [Halogeometricum sp. S3BR5-2]MDS0293678.1 DNA photolyase family protein [Halogeometricum sp. S3BR5-2]